MFEEHKENENKIDVNDVKSEIIKRARVEFFSQIIKKVFKRKYKDEDYDKFSLRMATAENGMVYYDNNYLGGFTQEIVFNGRSFNLLHNFYPKKK
jgi:hypothetical protein